MRGSLPGPPWVEDDDLTRLSRQERGVIAAQSCVVTESNACDGAAIRCETGLEIRVPESPSLRSSCFPSQNDFMELVSLPIHGVDVQIFSHHKPDLAEGVGCRTTGRCERHDNQRDRDDTADGSRTRPPPIRHFTSASDSGAAVAARVRRWCHVHTSVSSRRRLPLTSRLPAPTGGAR